MKNEKSFTVIELLVVVAMIGLIASLVLVRVQDARERARIASALDFSHTLQNILGADAVGVWNFDEGGESTAYDNSGYGNNGTINDAYFMDSTPHEVIGAGEGKYALSFDGNDYVIVPNSPSISDYSNGITVELWFKTSRVDVSQGQYGQNGPGYINFWMPYGTSYTQLRWETNGGQAFYSNTKIYPNKWYHAVGIYNNSTGKASLFINGILDKEASLTFTPTKTADVTIGGYSATSYRFYGLIDEVRTYTKALTSAQIQEHYLAGLKSHLSYQ